MSRPIIRRQSSSFIIGFQQLKDQMEIKDHQKRVLKEPETKDDTAKPTEKGKDKQKDALKDSEGFRDMIEHKISLDDLVRNLETSIEKGLGDELGREKLKQYGENKLTEKKAMPWYCLFFKELTGFFSLLLWVGSLLCFIAYGLSPADPSNMYLGIVLAVVVFLTGCFSFYQESQSLAIMAGFKDMIPPTCTVIRGGTPRVFESSKLVPGDIVILKQGARIPADVRVIEANNMKVDNSSLTGESEPQTRTPNCTNEHNPLETENLAFFGTMCSSGDGKGMVVFTGDRTIMGKIANLTAETHEEETTLGIEIARFVKMISIIAIALGVIFFILGFIYGYSAIVNMVNAIGIIVANVPEGLLATVTVALTLTAKRMASKNVLVKNLEAVETLGSTSCICSDKTGTLTENKMKVVNIWYDGTIRSVTNYEEKDTTKDLGYDISEPTFQMLQRCASLNSKAEFSFEPDSKLLEDSHGNSYPQEKINEIKEKYLKDALAASVQTWKTVGGDASEVALIKFFNPIYEIDKFRKDYPVMVRQGVKGEIPFNSANKYAITIHEPCDWFPSEHRKDCILFMKGAPEQLWERCSMMMKNGKEVPKDDEWKQLFAKANKTFGSQGQRVLGFAYIWLEDSKFGKDYVFNPNLEEGPNFPLKGLTFIGLTALMDPPKRHVKEAVISCHEAGIKVIMVTGDQPLTATAIARQVQIITEPKTVNELVEEGLDWDSAFEKSDAIVIHGDMLTKASAEDEDLPFNEQRIAKWLSKHQIVFARTSPAQKYMIVDANQKLGQIVAVTGDGVNDSPAIKKADIGIAMNISGSDVAKDAADMLLIDDNFASIVDGVKEGRVIFDNLKKTIAYILTSNIPELIPFLALIIFQIPLALSTVLILCIDLGTDIMPSVAMAYESAELDIMKRMPRDAKKDYLVTGQLLFYSYCTMGEMQTCAGYMAYFTVLHDYGFSPSVLWFIALRDDGTKPSANDIYDPYLPHKGNSHVGDSSYDGEQVDYISDSDGKYDLRIWFYKINKDDWDDCRYPDMKSEISNTYICYTPEAVKYAQFAFFIAIVVCQWSNVLNVKTRTQSLLQQGITNRVLIFSLWFELALALFLTFTPPLNVGLGTRPLAFLHWGFPAVPFFVSFILFDEGRKAIIRYTREKNPKRRGWVDRNTYY